MWRTWRPIFGWPCLCPVLFADPLGLVVIMPRAVLDLSAAESERIEDDFEVFTTAEGKPEDYGRLHERIVAIDYGLADAGQVREQRAYYRAQATRYGHRVGP